MTEEIERWVLLDFEICSQRVVGLVELRVERAVGMCKRAEPFRRFG